MSANILIEFDALIRASLLPSSWGGGITMGAFCIYGISRSVCRAAAEKKIISYDVQAKRNFSLVEWSDKCAALAEKLFAESARRVKVSPELDTPQFCRDWLAINPDQVRDPVVMVRGTKRDKEGKVMQRNGRVMETWLEYSAECARLGIEVAPCRK